MPYDQIKLEEEKLLLLKQYEPIGVIGVMNPYISGVPFIYLHELTAEYAEPKILLDLFLCGRTRANC